MLTTPIGKEFTGQMQKRKLDDGGQAGVDVTPEMIKAGVAEFLSYDSRDLVDTPAQEIVRGILVAALESASSSPLSGREQFR